MPNSSRTAEEIKAIHRRREKDRYTSLIKKLNALSKMVPGHHAKEKKADKLRRITLYCRYLDFCYRSLVGKELKNFSSYETFLFGEKSSTKKIVPPSTTKGKANIIFLEKAVPEYEFPNENLLNGSKNLWSLPEDIFTTLDINTLTDEAYDIAQSLEETMTDERIPHNTNVKLLGENEEQYNNFTLLSQEFSNAKLKSEMSNFDVTYENENNSMFGLSNISNKNESTWSESGVMSYSGANDTCYPVDTLNEEVSLRTPSYLAESGSKSCENNLYNADDLKYKCNYTCTELDGIPIKKELCEDDCENLEQSVECQKNSPNASPRPVMSGNCDELKLGNFTFQDNDFKALCAILQRKVKKELAQSSVRSFQGSSFNSWNPYDDQYLINNCFEPTHYGSTDLEELLQLCEKNK